MFNVCVHDGSLEVFMPNAGLHKPWKTIGGSEKKYTKAVDCQTLQNERGLTKLPMILEANKFRRHLMFRTAIMTEICLG